MAKKNEIIVKDVSIKTMTINGVDYICITDIAKQKNSAEPKDVVKNWMRQKNTLEYLGLWEKLNNGLYLLISANYCSLIALIFFLFCTFALEKRNAISHVRPDPKRYPLWHVICRSVSTVSGSLLLSAVPSRQRLCP